MASVLLPEESIQPEMKHVGVLPEMKHVVLLLDRDNSEDEELDLDDKNRRAILYDGKDIPTSDDGEEEEDDDGEEEDDDDSEEEGEDTPTGVDVKEEDQIPSHYYTSSDEEDRYGCRKMTQEENEIYVKHLSESQGFDVPLLPKAFMFHIIQPVNCESQDMVILDDLSKLAIEEYNGLNETNYSFARVTKANAQAARGIRYYITFEAMNADCTKTFQAKVLDGIPDVEVEMCRVKPDKKS